MKPSYRIFFLITSMGLGGADKQLLELACRLRARGHLPFVVSLVKPGPLGEELQRQGIPYVSLQVRSPFLVITAILKLVKLIRKWRPDIVHSHMVHANILARIVRLLAPIPILICSARNINEGGRFRELLYRFTDPLCDLTTQVSQAGLERYVRVGAVPRHKVRYIPNGVDTERFKPDAEARFALRKELDVEDFFVWLAVGRFYPQKDYPNMLQAFAQVACENPKTVLLIAGDGPLRESMENMAQGLGIERHVKFLGIRRDIPRLMNVADAYVMSSSWEGMPNVLLEASATGLPIVATDVGGNREVVLDGVTGFLVPPKDSEALAQAMLRLMTLPRDVRGHMGERARQYIEKKFSMERIVDRWEELYRELLQKRGLL